MKKRRSEVEKEIANFAKAIGMGIVTETTKSSLLALESERNQLDAELSRKALLGRSFTKEEISTSLLKIGREGCETPSQKRGLLNNFVKRIDIDASGMITFQFDLFGYAPSGTVNVSDLKKVKLWDSATRKFPFIRTLYISKYGFAMAFRTPKTNKPIINISSQ